MDATGIAALTEIVQRFQKRGIHVLLCGLHGELPGLLASAGLLRLVGEQNVCADMQAVARRVESPL
jgi:SulP family sulfate permease